MTVQPPVWVVSLTRATARREYVVRAFADVGIPIELFEAVDGRSLTPAQRDAYGHRQALYNVGRGLTAGELAIVHTHLAAYRRMLDEHIPALVLAEDDAEPSADLSDVLAAVDALPADWDVVTLYSMYPWSDPVPIDDRVFADRYRVCRYRRTTMGTQCYMISAHGAQRMLDVALPIRLPIDEMLFRSRPAGLRVYGIEPNPVTEHPFLSELGQRGEPVSTGSGHDGPLDRAIVATGKLSARLHRYLDRRRSSEPAGSGDG
jgi:glycosyl transferase, family 25